MDVRDEEVLFDRSASGVISYEHLAFRSQANELNEAVAPRQVRVEIDAKTLLKLLKGRRLCATDMRCLDCESKRCLMRLLLRACAQDLAETDPMDRRLIAG
jgi:hypothetical protein